MGALESLRNLLGGSERGTIPVTLAGDERELLRVAASVVRAGLSVGCGDLVITDQRVLFAPLNTADVAAVLTAGLKLADAPGGSTAVVGFLQRRIDGATVLLDDVTDARAGTDGSSMLKAPTVVFTRGDGQAVEFGALATRTTLTNSLKNRAARDDLLLAVQGPRVTGSDPGASERDR